ncbi:MAG TPA: acyltransferase family protein [Acidimicrobiia bacterium]|nr:acyltransferase family protein [Acidimicrobiia bacterium]
MEGAERGGERIERGGAKIAHISALDGARGLAVAGVLLFHGNHLRGGYLGVDFFFTLSGFLITTLLLAESSRSGAVSLGNFWARRARRLLPALAVLMVGVVVYAQVLAKPGELSQIRGDAFATLLYAANWHEIFSHTSYFALFSAPSPLNHTWSLAIEEQFYVIWPLLFVVLLTRFKRATPKAVLATSLGLATVSSVLMVVLYDPAHNNRVYFGTDTRAAAILFGAALAAALAAYGPPTRRSDRIALEISGLAGLAVLAIAWTRLDGQSSTLYRGGFLVCGLAATAIIATAVHPDRMLVARALSFGPLCGLGLISYGVYLYHWPIDVALDAQRAHLNGWPLFGLQTAVALAAAVLSYRYIEQPIRRGRVNTVQLRRLTPVVAVALALALFATTSGASSAPAVAAPNTPSSANLMVESALVARQRATADAPRVMVVGNSVAFLLARGFVDLQATPKPVVFNGSVLGCIFPPEILRPPAEVNGGIVDLAPCHPAWEARAVAAFRPTVVYWIASTRGAIGGKYRGQTMTGCSPLFDEVYERDLRREIAQLGRFGAKVVITTSAYSRRDGAANDPAQDDCENAMRRSVAAATGSQLVDLFSYVCPKGECRSKIDGVTLRSDGLHYEGAGADLVARWLYSQVRSP